MRFFLLLFLLFPALISQAQITITTSEFPLPGVEYVVSNSNTTDTVYRIDGPNQTWDFGDLVPIYQDTVSYFDPGSTLIPLTYRSVFNQPSDPNYYATVSSCKDSLVGLPGFLSITEVYNFYKRTSYEWEQVGFGANFNGIPTAVKLSPKDVILELPAQYGDTSSSYSSFNLSVPSLGYYMQEKTRQNYIDGYGTVITPFGSYNAIKVTSYLTIHDSLYIDAYSWGINFYMWEIQYNWYAHEFQIPVLKVVERASSDVAVSYIDSVRVLAANELIISQISAFPNPVENNLFFDIPACSFPLVVEIYDQQGRIVLGDEIMNSGIDVSGLESGLYSIRLRNEKDVFVSKFLKK